MLSSFEMWRTINRVCALFMYLLLFIHLFTVWFVIYWKYSFGHVRLEGFIRHPHGSASKQLDIWVWSWRKTTGHELLGIQYTLGFKAMDVSINREEEQKIESWNSTILKLNYKLKVQAQETDLWGSLVSLKPSEEFPGEKDQLY